MILDFHSFPTAWVVGFIFYSRFSAFTFHNVYKNWTGCVPSVSLPISLQWLDSYVRTGKELTAGKSRIGLFLVQGGLEQSLKKKKAKPWDRQEETVWNQKPLPMLFCQWLPYLTSPRYPPLTFRHFFKQHVPRCDAFKFLKLSVTTFIYL